MAEQKKWAAKLSTQCGIAPKVLESVLEELSESCYGDSAASKKVIEELTLSCRMNEEELRTFIGDVSKSCPMDAKKLNIEVAQARGDKERVFQAINRVARKPI